MTTPINLSQLLLPGFRKIYGDSYADIPTQYDKVYEIDTSSKSKEEDQGLSTLGLAVEKPVMKSITFDTVYQGYTKTYTPITYALGFMIAKETWDDALYRNVKQLPKALGRSVRHTIEILGANVLNNAFSASYLGADGKELCATDHPLLGGGTFRNELTTPADLDVISFEQCLIDIRGFVDDRGLKVVARPKLLVIPPQLEFAAKMLLKSEKLPDTANNNINPANGMMPYIVLDWLTDPDAFFILTDVPNGLNFIWREKPRFGTEDEWNSEVSKFKVVFRCANGWTDSRCVFGSPGA